MKIIVLFKTHLDVGFTDFSENVVKKYYEYYIPRALTVAEEIASLGCDEGFVWTVGSWLIDGYLRTADEQAVKRLSYAIEKGMISWHALPFTMHSEICTAELYDYGLSISRNLDARFGRTTTGAKCTDVPGHTAAIIPHLCDAGVTFLHIGVNPASTPADVPPVFRWQYGEKEITVMYNGGGYGEFTHIPGTDTYVYFAHTGDNLGPQSAKEIMDVYRRIHEQYPRAEVKAGDLNDLARAVEAVCASLPVVSAEIGDTWIHGAASDPQKITQYRELLRYAKQAGADSAKAIYEHLLPVPEHTWGLDEKSHLDENCNYIRPLFEKARNNYRYKKMELSWAEQRKYVLDAAASIEDDAQASGLLSAYYIPEPDIKKWQPISSDRAAIAGMAVKFSENGEITSLDYPDGGISLENCAMFGFSYDEYAYDEVWEYQKQYLRKSYIQLFEDTGKLNWAINDFGKYGLQYERNYHTVAVPTAYDLYTDGRSLLVYYTVDEKITAAHGQPARCYLQITPQNGSILFEFSWFDKPANRAPEAMWLHIRTAKALRGISKLGYMIDPQNVVGHGGRGLHATDGEIRFDGLRLMTHDAILLSLGGKNIYRFVTDIPSSDGDIYVNLFNNQWGTNFPMWNEGDGRARFTLCKQTEIINRPGKACL